MSVKRDAEAAPLLLEYGNVLLLSSSGALLLKSEGESRPGLYVSPFAALSS